MKQKIVTDDIYNNILTICGVPRLNDKPSGGDTGQGKITRRRLDYGR